MCIKNFYTPKIRLKMTITFYLSVASKCVVLVNRSQIELLFTMYLYCPSMAIYILSILFSVLSCFKFSKISNFLTKEYYAYVLFFVRLLFVFLFIILTYMLIVYTFFFDSWLVVLLSLMDAAATRTVDTIALYLKFGVNTNPVGWAIFYTCFLASITSLIYIGDVDFLSKGSSVIYYCFFLICTWFMITTHNFLTMFLSFEFLFFASMIYLYTWKYGARMDRALGIVFSWTLFGSFLVLVGLGYAYSLFDTLDYQLLISKSYTSNEKLVLFLLFFIGFGVKIPLFPFHYWLTKIHVEAPAGFSMFLSGFLVKAAVYCIYQFSLVFMEETGQMLAIGWVLVTVLESSIKMWSQVDIKKLIAFSTIQEMGMIVFLLITLPVPGTTIHLTFIIMHGLLSTYMFFLVDKVQKIAQTRNITALAGLVDRFPILRFYIWVMLLLYSGLPLSVKFLVEWVVGYKLLVTVGGFGLVIFVFSFIFGAVGFMRCWLLILYGNPSTHLINCRGLDLNKKDILFCNLIIAILFLLNILVFIV